MKKYLLLFSLVLLFFLCSCKGKNADKDTFQSEDASFSSGSSGGSEEFMQAKKFMAEERIISAYKIYKKLIVEDPTNVEILKDLGDIEYGLRKYDDAIKYFLQATEVSPNDGELYYKLGNAYYRKGNNDKYLENYRKSADCGFQIVIDFFAAQESDAASTNSNSNQTSSEETYVDPFETDNANSTNSDKKVTEENNNFDKSSIIDEYE